MNSVDTTLELVERVYATSVERIQTVRSRLGRPLTLAEKVLLSHLDDPSNQDLVAGESYLLLRPDRLAMQDATAQMALLQFMLAGQDKAAVPSTVHCDHLLRAYQGAAADTATAIIENREVYEFLESVSQRYGIGFWKPGSGIIHQVVLENYAFPGGMLIGTDSHTPNAGGLCMLSSGVGGADAVDVMAGFPWEVKYPRLVGVRLTGELSGWTAPKDIILKLLGILTTKGGTNRIIEYFGPGTRSISCTGKATITNMGAELGATGSLFPYDHRMRDYLRSTRRSDIAALADRHPELLTADPEVEQNPERFFERIVEIDLSALEPHIVGPHRPDLARPLSQMAADIREKGYPEELSAALIGSCTNSSYEDMGRAADVARQAAKAGIRARTTLMITPGSAQVFSTLERDGQLQALNGIGGLVLSNACGPCIGQWKRDDLKTGQPNSILTSYNRNFPKRNDGSPDTLAFIGSPEIVVALSLAGKLSFDPSRDSLIAADGREVKLDPPARVDDVPTAGFVETYAGYLAPRECARDMQVVVEPDSSRLQLLTPFEPWDGKDYIQLPLLLKAKGQCTTDAISMAGPWLKYRGHLDKISDNMFLGAVNAFTGETGKGMNLQTGEKGMAFAQIARRYKSEGLRWIAVGDENYGEGSSREHAAMSPRHLGMAAIITRSYARIHESNLKKQGILPFTFADPRDYDLVQEQDRISIHDLGSISPSQGLRVTLHHADGSESMIRVLHTLSAEQIEWFKAGSALNLIRSGRK